MNAMTTYLNCWLFKTVTDLNGKDRYSDKRDLATSIKFIIKAPGYSPRLYWNRDVRGENDTLRILACHF